MFDSVRGVDAPRSYFCFLLYICFFDLLFLGYSQVHNTRILWFAILMASLLFKGFGFNSPIVVL